MMILLSCFLMIIGIIGTLLFGVTSVWAFMAKDSRLWAGVLLIPTLACLWYTWNMYVWYKEAKTEANESFYKEALADLERSSQKSKPV